MRLLLLCFPHEDKAIKLLDSDPLDGATRRPFVDRQFRCQLPGVFPFRDIAEPIPKILKNNNCWEASSIRTISLHPPRMAVLPLTLSRISILKNERSCVDQLGGMCWSVSRSKTGSGERTRTSDHTGYEPGKLPLLHPAINIKNYWSLVRDSNPRPADYKSAALSTELTRRSKKSSL